MTPEQLLEELENQLPEIPSYFERKMYRISKNKITPDYIPRFANILLFIIKRYGLRNPIIRFYEQDRDNFVQNKVTVVIHYDAQPESIDLNK